MVQTFNIKRFFDEIGAISKDEISPLTIVDFVLIADHAKTVHIIQILHNYLASDFPKAQTSYMHCQGYWNGSILFNINNYEIRIKQMTL